MRLDGSDVVVTGMIYGLTAGMAAGTSLAFLAVERGKILIRVLVTAVLCGSAAFFLEQIHAERYVIPGVILLWFAILSLAVSAQNGRVWSDAVICFFLSVGADSIFLTAFGMPGETDRMGVILGTTVLVVFAAVSRKLFRFGLEAGWREFYRQADGIPGKMELKLPYFYGILALICLVPAAGLWIREWFHSAACIVWVVSAALFYWMGIFAALVMNTCKKERVTIQAEQQYRDEMGNFMNVIRSQRHDYNFHVQTIAGLIHAGKIDECMQYVDDLERDAAVMNAVLPVKDAAISALIHNFQILAAREGIELYIDIQNDLSQIATNVYETNKIISNLLQNALDETVTHKDKSYGIRLSVLKRGEYCVIRVSNELEKAAGDLQSLGRIYQQGYSTKHGHDGVGLSSIRTLAARYQGTVYTQIEGKVIHFVAKIPINYAKSSEE